MKTAVARRISRAIKEAWFGRDRVRDEDGLSLWTVLGGLLLSALITALFVIPNLLGARSATQNAAPQHNLQAALPAAKVLYGSQNGTYTGTPLTGSNSLHRAEPTLTFTSSATTAPENISVSTTSAGKSIVMAAASPTGKCYYIADIEDRSSALVTGSPITGAGTWYASAASPGGGCVASSPASNWQQNGFPPA